MSYYDGLEKVPFLSCNKDFRHGFCFKKLPSQPRRKLVLGNRMVQKGFLFVGEVFWGLVLVFFFG